MYLSASGHTRNAHFLLKLLGHFLHSPYLSPVHFFFLWHINIATLETPAGPYTNNGNTSHSRALKDIEEKSCTVYFMGVWVP